MLKGNTIEFTAVSTSSLSLNGRTSVFNSICKSAILDELLDFEPVHPTLPKDKKKKGQRLNSFAFPTQQMILDLLEVAEIQKNNKEGKLSIFIYLVKNTEIFNYKS